MNQIKVEYTLHSGKEIVKLIFGYDAALAAELRKRLPDARRSRTMRYRYVPDTQEKFMALKQLGILIHWSYENRRNIKNRVLLQPSSHFRGDGCNRSTLECNP